MKEDHVDHEIQVSNSTANKINGEEEILLSIPKHFAIILENEGRRT